jgi:hypothetical protein
MRPHPALALLILLQLAACDAPDAGPRQVREGAFKYQSRMVSGAVLYVRTARGEITVEPSADDSVRVRGDVSWVGIGDPMEGISLTGQEVTDGVLICAHWGTTRCTTDEYSANLSGRARSTKVHYTIRVPAGVRLDLVSMDGDIVSASTASVSARGVNGDITVVTARGPVRAETINGDVDARMSVLDGTDSVIVKTLNGDAWVFLPEAASIALDLTTTNGAFVTDFPELTSSAGGRRNVQATLGAGTTPVRVRSMNGTVGVRRLDAMGRAYELRTP